MAGAGLCPGGGDGRTPRTDQEGIMPRVVIAVMFLTGSDHIPGVKKNVNSFGPAKRGFGFGGMDGLSLGERNPNNIIMFSNIRQCGVSIKLSNDISVHACPEQCLKNAGEKNFKNVKNLAC